uniref:DDE Tnp4 domain-containing protein n=1 Tax=Lactuca sativa TaxID=4236 RepID=A0A9R1VNL2_LACSA|nr:hypothetical protein LSAT_V11C500244000 [Lactuca sativa]
MKHIWGLTGTHIKCLVPLEDKPRYRTRKNDIATNVLGVCSQDMQFIYVLPGWEGSAADSRVLRNALLRPNGLKIRRITIMTNRRFLAKPATLIDIKHKVSIQ